MQYTPANISCFPRRLEDVLKTCLQNLFQRRLQDVLKTSSQDVLKTSSNTSSSRRLQEDVFKASSRRRLAIMSWRRLQDVLKDKKIVTLKTSSRRLQEEVLQLCLEDVFNTSWKTKKCYGEDVFKTSSRRLQYVFFKTNVCWDILPFSLKTMHKMWWRDYSQILF